MQLLKQILKRAIGDKAAKVALTENQPPQMTVNGSETPMSDPAAISPQDLQGLYQFLFPKAPESLSAGQPTKGVLNVPGLGKLQVIAISAAPARLFLYLPSGGAELFEQDWKQFTEPANAAGQGAAGAPPPPPGAGAPPPGAGAPPPGAGAPPAPGAGAPPPPAPGGDVADAPPIAPVGGNDAPAAPDAGAPAGGGFIPPGIGGGEEPPLPPGPVQPPSDAGGEAPAAAPPPPGGDPQAPAGGGGFVPGMEGAAEVAPPAEDPPPPPGPVSPPPAEAQSAPGPGPAPAPAPGPAPGPVADPSFQAPAPAGGAPSPFPGPPTSAPSAEPQSPAEIHYGPDKPGESPKSDGSNPVDKILYDMIDQGASDLHLTVGEPVAFRIDGEIARQDSGPIDMTRMQQLLEPILPARNREEFAETDDTDFAYEIEGLGRFRVNIFRDRNGVDCVMRHIPSKILSAEQLGLPPAITQFSKLTKGLVLVTGPTGSGKSTTLAALMDYINKSRSDHILTIEDPIEFVYEQAKCLVHQRELHRHTGSFSRALKAALREDPDIVLIGELRDLETIAIAMETAETGHLVFGTLHTTTAVSTIDRLIDQFPSDQQEQIRMMLAGSLRGVVAQTLLKKLGGGRVAAHEILVSSDAVSAMIREGKNHMIENHMQSQKNDGNMMLNESLTRLVKEKLVDPKEAYRKAVDKKRFVDMLKRIGVNVGDLELKESA